MLLLKRLSFILISILLILILILTAVFIIFNSNDLKPYIEQQFYQSTHQRLQIDQIELSLYPDLGLKIQGLRINNPSGFQSPFLAQIERARISLDPFSLWQSPIQIKLMQLQGAIIYLEQQKGHSNWQALLPAQRQQKSGQAPAIQIQAIHLEQADLYAQNWQIKDLQADLAWQEDRIIPLKLSWQSQYQNWRWQNQIHTDMSLDLQQQRLDLSALQAQIRLEQPAIHLQIAADLRFDFQQELLEIADFSLAIDQVLDITGKLSLADFKQPQMEALLRWQLQQPRRLLDWLHIAWRPPNEQALQNLSGEAFIHQQGQDWLFKPVELQLDQSHIQGQIVWRDQRLQLKLHLDQINLDHYLASAASEDSSSAPPHLDFEAELSIDHLIYQGIAMDKIQLHWSAEQPLQVKPSSE